MLDASAILRETLELKKKLALLQCQLMLSFAHVDRVVDLVTPGVAPERFLDIIEETRDIATETLLSTSQNQPETREPSHAVISPKTGTAPLFLRQQSLVSVQEGRLSVVTHDIAKKISDSRTSIAPSIHLIPKASMEHPKSYRQSRIHLDSQLLTLEQEKAEEPKADVPKVLVSGVRWDNDDYVHKSAEVLNVTENPVTLRKSETITKKLKKKNHADNISLMSNGTTKPEPKKWINSLRSLTGSYTVLKTHENDRAADTGSEDSEQVTRSRSKDMAVSVNSLGKSATSLKVQQTSNPVQERRSHTANQSRFQNVFSQDSLKESESSASEIVSQTDRLEVDTKVDIGFLRPVSPVTLQVDSSNYLSPNSAVTIRSRLLDDVPLEVSTFTQNSVIDPQRSRSSSFLRFADPRPEPQKATTSFQRLCLCRAFNEKGKYVPYTQRQADSFGKISFTKSGIHPMSMVSSICGLIFILLYCITIIVEPYFAAYYPDTATYTEISWIISIFLLLETVVNLVTPKRSSRDSDGHLHLSQWIKNYLWTNLILDLLSMIPWHQIITAPNSGFPLSLIRLLRFHRLASMMSHNPFLMRLVHRIESIGEIGAILSRIIPLGVVFAMFLHIEACFLYYIGSLNKFDTWNIQFDHWKYFPGGVEEASIKEKYMWMLTQSVGNVFQMTFKPETMGEQATTLVFIVCGAVLYALLVGLLSSAAVAYDSSGRLYRQKIDELTEYLKWKHIDKETQKKVLGYYEYKYRGKYFEEQTLLADLNGSLRMELATINCRRLIEKVPFLKRDLKDGRDDIYLGKISTALRAAYYVTGDYVFNQGEIGEEMFFIQSGTVNILTNGRFVTSFKDGSFFGEVALIANIPRTASVQAATPCTLYALSSSQFADIISEFDDMKARVDEIYKDRMEKIKQVRELKRGKTQIKAI
ncbi:anaphase-promoting complex subunit Hcn1 [Rhizoclosmatium sp. JEL0117]|nr:anaphase-promoting complex subunit Hcn1 [Rhizoclosmatium sp. JEL0117]